MSATGKTPILLYGSTTATNVPVAANLTNSSDGCEIAINVADKNLFFKDSTNVVNTVPIRQASASSNGWLSSTDWSTFNGKVSSQWTYSGGSIYYNANVSVNTSSVSSNIALTVGQGNADWTLGTNYALYIAGSGYQGGMALNGTSFQIGQNSASRNLTLHSGTAFAEQVRIDPTGNVTLQNGNLVIGTSGKGIDFSATAGTGTSELLADYEEGTWTPTPKFGGGNTGMTYTSTGFYTKVGNQVTVWGTVSISSNGSSTGSMTIEGLPYSIAGYSTGSLIGDGFTFTGAQLAVFAANGLSALYAVNQLGGTGSSAGYAYLTQAAISTGGKYFSITYRTS